MASTKFKLTSLVVLPRKMDLSPNATSFPGTKRMGYGGDGVLGVFDAQHIEQYFKPEELPEVRRAIGRAIAKGGAYPLGGDPTTLADRKKLKAANEIVIETQSGQSIKRPVQRRSTKGNKPGDLLDVTSGITTSQKDAGEFVEILRG